MLLNIEIINHDLQIFVQVGNEILTSFCHLLVLMVIAFGVVGALVTFLREFFSTKDTDRAFQKSRLMMGYSFSLGLSFLIGATILKTMVSSQWNDLVRLAIIILIRTTINLLLERATKGLSSETLMKEY
jgi:uncharacterized membrane protein